MELVMFVSFVSFEVFPRSRSEQRGKSQREKEKRSLSEYCSAKIEFYPSSVIDFALNVTIQ